MFDKYILLKCILLFQNNENYLQKTQLWSNLWNKFFFFPYRRSQGQFSQTDEPSYYLGRNICDSELHVHVHRVPYSFLVCSVPQWSSAVSSERNNGKHKELWSQECERPKLPYFEILTPGIRLSVYYCLLRDAVPGAWAGCTKTSRAHVRCVVSPGTSNWGAQFSLTESPLGYY